MSRSRYRSRAQARPRHRSFARSSAEHPGCDAIDAQPVERAAMDTLGPLCWHLTFGPERLVPFSQETPDTDRAWISCPYGGRRYRGSAVCAFALTFCHASGLAYAGWWRDTPARGRRMSLESAAVPVAYNGRENTPTRCLTGQRFQPISVGLAPSPSCLQRSSLAQTFRCQNIWMGRGITRRSQSLIVLPPRLSAAPCQPSSRWVARDRRAHRTPAPGP